MGVLSTKIEIEVVCYSASMKYFLNRHDIKLNVNNKVCTGYVSHSDEEIADVIPKLSRTFIKL